MYVPSYTCISRQLRDAQKLQTIPLKTSWVFPEMLTSAWKGVWHEIFDFKFLSCQCTLGPQVFHGGCFEFFLKFVEIFANECSSSVSTTLAISCSTVSTTPATNLLPGSLTLAINSCYGFSVITGDNDTGEQLSLWQEHGHHRGGRCQIYWRHRWHRWTIYSRCQQHRW